MNVENLQKLFEVGQRILRKRLPLAFGDVECGSFACLSGWYERETGESEHIDAWMDSAPSVHFGTSAAQTTALFRSAGSDADYPGPEAYAELERRMEYLAGLIREAGGEVPKYTRHEGIPESVLGWFAEKVA